MGVIAPLDTELLHSTAVRLQVQSVRLRGLTFRFSGASAASLYVAGRGLICDLAAGTDDLGLHLDEIRIVVPERRATDLASSTMRDIISRVAPI